MSKTFAIAGPPAPVRLEKGSGSAGYTVTNTSAEDVEGTLSLHAQAPAADEWLALPGAPTQVYAAGAVVAVAVTITVPAGTAAGTYAFRLDAERAANPEEDYTEGPLAAFVVPPPPDVVPWWKRYWWALALAALVVIALIVFLIANGGGGGSASVTPTLTGLKEADATSALSRQGLFVGLAGTLFTGRQANGIVLAQAPAARAPVPQNKHVDLIVEQNVTVPDVTGQSLSSARAALTSSGVKVDEVAEPLHAGEAENSVVSVWPPRGTRVKPGSTVKVAFVAAWATPPPAAPTATPAAECANLATLREELATAQAAQAVAGPVQQQALAVQIAVLQSAIGVLAGRCA